MLRPLLIVLNLSVCICFPVFAQGDVLTVRVEGRAQGLGFAARDAALADAERQAVEKVLESLVGVDDLRSLQAILRNAAGYVKHSDILREDSIDDMTRVEIDAQVALGPLHRDIAGIMLPRLSAPPRVQLLLGEKLGPAPIVTVPDFGIAEVTLVDGMDKAGIEVTGADALNQTFTHASLVEIVNGGVEEGSRFARSRDADLVMVGTAVEEAGEAGGNGQVLRTRVLVTLKIFRTSDGKMLEELSAAGVVHGQDAWINGEEAAQDACRRLLGDVIDATVLAMLAMADAGEIVVTVEQPGKPDRVNALIQYLLADDEVRSVEQTFYADNLARLRVAYRGDMVRLADMLAPVVCEGRKLEVLSVVGRAITVSF